MIYLGSLLVIVGFIINIKGITMKPENRKKEVMMSGGLVLFFIGFIILSLELYLYVKTLEI